MGSTKRIRIYNQTRKEAEMKLEKIIEVNGKYYRQYDDTPGKGCNACDLNAVCESFFLNETCNSDHFNEVEKEPTEEVIRKVLRLSDKAFKESCLLVIGVTINERIENLERLKRQQAGLSSEERIKYIKDHWDEDNYVSSDISYLKSEANIQVCEKIVIRKNGGE